ncbi:MAG: FHA domain-containing protein [Oligoflexia bacterium]
MYRLTVVAGPTRGNAYPLHDGETTVGRLSENTLVLNSGKVSKKHCVIEVRNGEVIVKDQSSANGTFVNGILARTPRRIIPGDRVSVGEFVLELSEIQKDAPQRAVALPVKLGAYDYKPSARSAGSLQTPAVPQTFNPMAAGPPRDAKGRLIWFFEFKVMPFFYSLLLRYEWRNLIFGAFGAFGLLAVFFVVAPQLAHEEALLVRELERRATVMARVLVEQNVAGIQQQQEGRTTIPPAISRSRGVRQALLLDLDSRILAPAERFNQYLSEGAAAVLARKAKRLFLDEGRTTTFVSSLDSGSVVAIEPMILFSPKEGRNLPVAMGVVTLDSSSALLGVGEMAVIYMEALLILGALGAVVALVLYRLTLKPLQVLYEEVDRSLKGEKLALTREIRFSELGQLLDMIEIALQRASLASASSGDGGGDSAGLQLGLSDDLVASFRMLGESQASPMAVCDSERRPLYLNTAFEEVTGIRLEIGETRALQELSREQSFGVLLEEMFSRCVGMPGGLTEAFEFSGIPFRVRMSAILAANGQPRGFVLAAQRSEGG